MLPTCCMHQLECKDQLEAWSHAQGRASMFMYTYSLLHAPARMQGPARSMVSCTRPGIYAHVCIFIPIGKRWIVCHNPSRNMSTRKVTAAVRYACTRSSLIACATLLMTTMTHLIAAAVAAAVAASFWCVPAPLLLLLTPAVCTRKASG